MKRWIFLAAAIMLAVITAVSGQSCTTYTEKESEELAKDFMEKSDTFAFDGMADTLKLVNTEKMDEATWSFTYEFQSRHGGYGDRTGQMLTQVITSHKAVITVKRNNISSAIMDDKWDMIEQKML